jgi:hypothetical protein
MICFLIFIDTFFFNDFSRRVLQITSGIENVDGIVTHLAVALAVAWLICFLALSKGVQSLGKVKLIRIFFCFDIKKKRNLFC